MKTCGSYSHMYQYKLKKFLCRITVCWCPTWTRETSMRMILVTPATTAVLSKTTTKKTQMWTGLVMSVMKTLMGMVSILSHTPSSLQNKFVYLLSIDVLSYEQKVTKWIKIKFKLQILISFTNIGKH